MSLRRLVHETSGKFALAAREAERRGEYRRAAQLYKAALIVLVGDGGEEPLEEDLPAGQSGVHIAIDANDLSPALRDRDLNTAPKGSTEDE